MVRIRIHTSIRALEQLRRLWEFIGKQGQGTTFQNFDWNLLAARTFNDVEEPFVIVGEASYGVAIVPAALSRSNGHLRLLGEELFDYRGFLHAGEDEVLRSTMAALAQPGAPLEVVAVRQCDRPAVLERLEWQPFTCAPSVNRSDVSAEKFGALHVRLARNLRRFQRQGFELKTHSGENSSLVRCIYQGKADHDPGSLFHDPLRVEFMIEAARLHPSRFEILTLESGTDLAAALVTFREHRVRRFYTCFFSPRFAKLSPAITLIHEATRQSLASGLDSDYMTGEQGYKMRLATSAMPLYRLRANAAQLAGLRGGRKALRPAV
jgi:CelD/BcsL family acetyltransferase involved in cellulose biosynthesis